MKTKIAVLAPSLLMLATVAQAAPPMTVTGIDGTQAPVKAASTASAASDPSLVVQLSPNGTVAAALLSTNSVAVTPCATVGAACVAMTELPIFAARVVNVGTYTQVFTNVSTTTTSTTFTAFHGGGYLFDYSAGTPGSLVFRVTGPDGTLRQAGTTATIAGTQCLTIGENSSINATATSPTGLYLSVEYVGTCPASAQQLIQATASAPITISTATTTQVVALSAGKQIFVTGWNVVAGGTGNFSLVYGTGTNCGTGTTALTGVYNLTAQSGLAYGGGLGPILVTPAGQALCVVDSAAVQMSGSVAYAQQ